MINRGSRSLKIGVFAGIPVKIHWSFGFVLLIIAYISFKDRLSLEGAGWLSLTFLMLFVCVVLHEYGHALAARRYGIDTVDILLTPIGGIARLKGNPQKPVHELVIAIAGPLVNLAIIILVGTYLYFQSGEQSVSELGENLMINSFQGLMVYLLLINTMLFTFNLIPAFPMDGGRVLRSLLSLKLDKVRATQIATVVGRIIAGIFVILALIWGNISLGIIGVFVYMMAQQEYAGVRFQHRIESALAKDILRTDFHFFYEDDPIMKALEVFRNTSEKSFLIYNRNNIVVGVLHELFLRQIQFSNPGEPISHWASGKFEFIEAQTSLKSVFDLMQKNGYSILPVIENNEVIGVVDRNDLLKFLNQKTR